MTSVAPATSDSLVELGQRVRRASRYLAMLSAKERTHAIGAIADALEESAADILAANHTDCLEAQAANLTPALYARLKLDEAKLQAAIAGVRDVSKLPDPLGVVQIHRELDQGLVLQRITCPLGVLGVIFEARPDAVIQIASLAVKSGNGVILKGGREAVHSCRALVQAIHQGLERADIDPTGVQLLTTREETLALLQLDQYVDLIIPRGSNSFVRFVQQHSRIPVLGHSDGICHLYIDRLADPAKAIALAVDAKTQYPAACNAIETLLIHQEIAPTLLPQLLTALHQHQVALLGDAATLTIAQQQGITVPLKPATLEDWQTEYSDLILAVRVVDCLAQAIDHINTYGSRHTEAIVTEDPIAASIFRAEVDAAGVYHNCSTRFADGFRYGFGAEVGISTHKLPPRGPVGLEGLVTYKYHLVGEGHIAATYAGPQARAFTHRDLPTTRDVRLLGS